MLRYVHARSIHIMCVHVHNLPARYLCTRAQGSLSGVLLQAEALPLLGEDSAMSQGAKVVQQAVCVMVIILWNVIKAL